MFGAGEVLLDPPTQFEVSFAEEFDPATVDPNDLTVNGVAADSVVVTSDRTLRFAYGVSPVVQDGIQTIAMSPDAITRSSDGSGLASFESQFRYDSLTTQIIATTPPQNQTVETPFTQIDVHFNEAIDPTSLDVDDLITSVGDVVSAKAVDADTVRYTFEEILDEGFFFLVIPAGAINDAFGNPSGASNSGLQLDYGELDFRAPLAALEPIGSRDPGRRVFD